MPTVERRSIPGAGTYLLVSVGTSDVFPNGKAVPHPGSLGTIDPETYAVNPWVPAARVFRGYKAAARAWLESIAEDVRAGRIAPSPG